MILFDYLFYNCYKASLKNNQNSSIVTPCFPFSICIILMMISIAALCRYFKLDVVLKWLNIIFLNKIYCILLFVMVYIISVIYYRNRFEYVIEKFDETNFQMNPIIVYILYCMVSSFGLFLPLSE